MVELMTINANDIDLLFKWANDPISRLQSMSNHEITYDEHVRWFNEKSTSDTSRIWIVRDGSTSVGQVRIDVRENGYGIISISVAPEFRGKGYGLEMLEVVTGMCDRGELPMSVHCLKAVVKKANVPSRKIFQRAGFMQYDENEELYVYWYPQKP